MKRKSVRVFKRMAGRKEETFFGEKSTVYSSRVAVWKHC